MKDGILVHSGKSNTLYNFSNHYNNKPNSTEDNTEKEKKKGYIQGIKDSSLIQQFKPRKVTEEEKRENI